MAVPPDCRSPPPCRHKKGAGTLSSEGPSMPFCEISLRPSSPPALRQGHNPGFRQIYAQILTCYVFGGIKVCLTLSYYFRLMPYYVAKLAFCYFRFISFANKIFQTDITVGQKCIIIAVLCSMRRERYNETAVQNVIRRLKEVRNSRGLSQDDVYIDTDINIARIEAGQGNVSISTLADLCNYYRISFEDFF